MVMIKSNIVNKLALFLPNLKQQRIFYTLAADRDQGIMVTVAVPA